ncbi:MAG: RsmE family RNA methyltransferase [Suipraeoptans sp.]
MQLFFVKPEDVQGNMAIVRGGDVSHISNVLRMKPGEMISISDGENFYSSEIRSINKDMVELIIKDKQTINTELSSKIFLFQCLPKLDKMDFVIMKAVELGVSKIIPVLSKRSIVKIDDKKAKKKRERWQAISESAAKQSKRGYIPEVSEVIDFEEALSVAKELDVVLFPYEEATGIKESKRVLESISGGNTIGIFIGPEGGFEEDEVKSSLKIGAKVITLGERILRTETAGMCVLSILGYLLESQDK